MRMRPTTTTTTSFSCTAIKESYSIAKAKIVIKANRIKIIKHSITNCLAFLNRMIRIVLIVIKIMIRGVQLLDDTHKYPRVANMDSETTFLTSGEQME